jgi:O-antigen/teichoic acid export membrane protein
VTTPVVSVMFPMISDLQGRDEKHYKLLFQSLLLVTVIGLIGVGGYYLLPQLVVKILYGKDYLATAQFLGFFGVIMLLYSQINLWVNYFLSIGNKAFVVWLALSAIVEIGLLSIRHQNFTFILQDLLAAMLIGFVGLTGYYLYLKRQQLAERFTTIKFAGPSAS